MKVPEQQEDVEQWWNQELENLSKKTRRAKAAFLMYTAWNLWKERNRRIFEDCRADEVQLEFDIKSEIMLRKLACGGPELV